MSDSAEQGATVVSPDETDDGSLKDDLRTAFRIHAEIAVGLFGVVVYMTGGFLISWYVLRGVVWADRTGHATGVAILMLSLMAHVVWMLLIKIFVDHMEARS